MAQTLTDRQVWLVDVGMSRYYGGQPAALEITSDGVVRIVLPQPAGSRLPDEL
jgi:hypothetical protein